MDEAWYFEIEKSRWGYWVHVGSGLITLSPPFFRYTKWGATRVGRRVTRRMNRPKPPRERHYV